MSVWAGLVFAVSPTGVGSVPVTVFVFSGVSGVDTVVAVKALWIRGGGAGAEGVGYSFDERFKIQWIRNCVLFPDLESRCDLLRSWCLLSETRRPCLGMGLRPVSQ